MLKLLARIWVLSLLMYFPSMWANAITVLDISNELQQALKEQSNKVNDKLYNNKQKNDVATAYNKYINAVHKEKDTVDSAKVNNATFSDISSEKILLGNEISSPVSEKKVNKSSVVMDSITVLGDYVTLGDIFTNIDDNIAKAEVVLSPKAGDTLVLPSGKVKELARKFSIDLISEPLQNLKISRKSEVVTPDTIKKLISRELDKHNVSFDYSIRLNRKFKIRSIATSDMDAIKLRAFTLDKVSNKFTAFFKLGSDSETITGSLKEVILVPMISRLVRLGTLIQKNDIKYEKVTVDRVHKNIIIDADDLIGKQAKYDLKPGKFVRVNDVKKFLVVKRNSLVKLNYSNGMISLSVMVKALQGGGIGDVITVRNLKSKRDVEAVIKNAKELEVINS